MKSKLPCAVLLALLSAAPLANDVPAGPERRQAEEMPMSDIVELIRAWLDVFPEGNFDAFPGRISPEFVLRLPFVPPGVPSEFRGREAAQAALSGSAKGRSKLVFSNVVILRTEDPELVVTTASAEAQMNNGRTYRNDYVMLTRIRDGVVLEHIEYLNPLAIIDSMREP